MLDVSATKLANTQQLIKKIYSKKDENGYSLIEKYNV
jgi:hypothetical protein